MRSRSGWQNDPDVTNRCDRTRQHLLVRNCCVVSGAGSGCRAGVLGWAKAVLVGAKPDPGHGGTVTLRRCNGHAAHIDDASCTAYH
jgi:hypothetical protein